MYRERQAPKSFRRFHEQNVKDEVEVLCRKKRIPELRGKFNTQNEEQLHQSFVRDNHFVNTTKLERHIFLRRVSIEHHNNAKNQKRLSLYQH